MTDQAKPTIEQLEDALELARYERDYLRDKIDELQLSQEEVVLDEICTLRFKCDRLQRELGETLAEKNLLENQLNRASKIVDLAEEYNEALQKIAEAQVEINTVRSSSKLADIIIRSIIEKNKMKEDTDAAKVPSVPDEEHLGSRLVPSEPSPTARRTCWVLWHKDRPIEVNLNHPIYKPNHPNSEDVRMVELHDGEKVVNGKAVGWAVLNKRGEVPMYVMASDTPFPDTKKIDYRFPEGALTESSHFTEKDNDG